MRHGLEPVGTLEALDAAGRFLVRISLGGALGAATQRAGSLRDERGSRGGSRGAVLISAPIAVRPQEGNKNGDQSNHNQHPVLAVESQKGKMFSEKLHRFPSLRFLCRKSTLLGQDKHKGT
jgi:hypothetical protein